MSNMKTQEEFVFEMSNLHYNIEVLGKYKGRKNRVLCKCKIDGNEWSPIVDSLYRGSGCAVCAGNKRKTTDEFIKEISKINKNIIILGKYINNATVIKAKCKICGHIWYPIPSSLTSSKNSCPRCAKESLRLTNQEFLTRLNKVNNKIKPMEVYNGIDTKIKLKCLKCNNAWYATPYHILNHRGCPKCNESKGEKKIARILKHCNIKYVQQVKYNDLRGVGNGLLSYDFYLPTYNLLIEYQGQYHDGTAGNQTEEQFKIQQEHDKRKRKYALDKNIKLLEIWYWDFDNIEQILESRLLKRSA